MEDCCCDGYGMEKITSFHQLIYHNQLVYVGKKIELEINVDLQQKHSVFH